MHLAMIIDDERLHREQAMLNRLAIGLMAEGVQLTRIVPDAITETSLLQGEQRIALVNRIETPMRVLPWMHRSRINRLVDALGKHVPDVLYAIGEKAWSLGLELGRALGRPVLIDVSSAPQVRRAPVGGRHSTIAGYVAACESLAAALRRRFRNAAITLAPMGVSIPSQPHELLADRDAGIISAAIIGGGRDVPAYQALLEGVGRAAATVSNLQIFLELRGRHEHEIWRTVQRLDLLSRTSTFAEASHYRSLLTRCDMMLLPEHAGELRSIMLEAMAAGLPIIASADPMLEMLIDGRTARLVQARDVDGWASHMTAVAQQPEQARQLGRQAREYVRIRHGSSRQINCLLEALGAASERQVAHQAAAVASL